MVSPPARPVAITTNESLVEVSPSIVTRLKLRSAKSRARARAAAADTAASVPRKASIVAMSGRIMPEPFTMPVAQMAVPATSARRDTAFGAVSVVMMA